jgi:hypothetical protein
MVKGRLDPKATTATGYAFFDVSEASEFVKEGAIITKAAVFGHFRHRM